MTHCCGFHNNIDTASLPLVHQRCHWPSWSVGTFDGCLPSVVTCFRTDLDTQNTHWEMVKALLNPTITWLPSAHEYSYRGLT